MAEDINREFRDLGRLGTTQVGRGDMVEDMNPYYAVYRTHVTTELCLNCQVQQQTSSPASTGHNRQAKILAALVCCCGTPRHPKTTGYVNDLGNVLYIR